jgi:ankyrin repeat protein
MSTVSDSALNLVLNLEYYRKQARALLKSARSGDVSSLQRISQHALPTRKKVLDFQIVALNDAQRAIACEQGFPNWNRFRAFVSASSSDTNQRALAFIRAALEDLPEAGRILAEHPEVASSGLAAALVLGDAERVKSLIELSLETTRKFVGPHNWQPLLYVCFSRFASRTSERRTALAELGKLLLQHGANPNGFYIPDEWPDNPLPCLFGATGLNNNPELAAALIDSGAILDDNESLYHSTEHADLECMRLLLERGANPNATNIIFHILDREAPQALTLLLDAGADVHAIHKDRNQTTLHWAVWRARNVETVRVLIDRGVDIDAVQFDGRSAYAMAFMSGQTEVANLLAANGADTTLSAFDRFVGECATASQAELLQMTSNLPDINAAPETRRMLADLAMSHRTAAVKALLRAGADVDSRGDSGATALHWACWHGHADTVKVLLDAGASLTIQDEQFQSTPPGWFGHGIHYCPDRSGDWLGVARELVAVGAKIPAVDIPTGNPDVDELLREHGYPKV